jgi:hypothetical protein
MQENRLNNEDYEALGMRTVQIFHEKKEGNNEKNIGLSVFRSLFGNDDFNSSDWMGDGRNLYLEGSDRMAKNSQ